jgi:hypothetical protein
VHLFVAKALEAFLTEKRLYKEHIVAGDEAADKVLSDEARKAHAAAKTRKCECLLFKSLSSATKTIDAQQKSIGKHMAELASSAKIDPVDWIFRPLFVEAKRVLAKKA